MNQKPNQPQGYFARPPGGSGRAVLILHAWWGLNDTIRAFCDGLAGAGFAVFALDLYGGRVAVTIDEAEKLAGGLDADRAKGDVAQATAFLLEASGQPEKGLAVIGFSLGAYYALDLSAAQPGKVHSVVLYYGVGPADFGRARAAYLGHFAADDPYEPAESVAWLESALTDAGRPVTFHTYPETGHWFAEPDRADAYHPAAAALAWERSLAFLGRVAE